MRPALLLVLAAWSACRDQSPAALEARYRQAEAEGERGQLGPALEAAGEIMRAAPPASELEWRSRLLAAELELTRDQPASARTLLSATFPAGLSGGPLEARYHKVWGEVARREGDTKEWAKRLDRATALAPPDLDHPLSIEILAQRGLQVATTGEKEEGRRLLGRALQLGGRAPRWRADARTSLGYLFLSEDRWEECLTQLDPALREAAELAVRPLVARIQVNRGICLTGLGDLTGARRALEQAVAIHQDLGAQRWLQNGLGSLANVTFLDDDIAQAIVTYQRALAIAREHDRRSAVRWSLNLAVLHGSRHDWAAARLCTEEARRLLHQLKDSAPNPHLLWNEARIAAGDGDLAGAERRFKEVVALTAPGSELRWETQGDLANLYRRLGRHDDAGHYFRSAFADAAALDAQVTSLDHRLRYVERLARLHRDHVLWLVGQGQMEAALAAYESSRVRLLAERQRRAGAAPAPLVPGDLRAIAAARGEVLLSFLLDQSESLVWVVDARAVRLIKVAPGPEIRRAVEAYRRFIEQSLRDPRQVAGSPAQELYRLLLAPLSEVLPAGAPVTVALDADLHGLPLGALVVPGERPRFWIEDRPVSVAPSLFSLGEPPNLRRALRQGELVAFGDPPPAGAEFPRLPSAEAELAALEEHFAALVPRHRRLVARGAAATPAAFLEAPIRSAALIHFAAHALADGQSPLDSTIVLARGPEGDRLSVRQVLEVPLRAELITVSACRGAGARRFFYEGLVGFAWGFLSAGARHVIAGLWDVPDRSTGALMNELYAELAKGSSPAQALRSAQLSLIRGGGAWATPFHWAAFQVYSGGAASPRRPS